MHNGENTLNKRGERYDLNLFNRDEYHIYKYYFDDKNIYLI
jgi:hypothetical protein